MKLDVDGVYVVHHKPLKSRKDLLLNRFSECEIENKINWIEDFLPEDIKDVDAYIYPEHKDKPGERLLPASLSNYMKQEKVLQIQKEEGLEYVLVHEDDVLIPYNYADIINSAIKEFRKMDCDLLMIGSCCGLFVSPQDIQKDKQVYYKPVYRTRCLHAYVINIKCIDILLEEFKIYDDAPDWKMNRIIDKYNLTCCWTKRYLEQNRNFKTTVKW